MQKKDIEYRKLSEIHPYERNPRKNESAVEKVAESIREFGRRCFMMELDPHYCDVIIDRWETFTGKKAELYEEVKQ